MKAVKQISIGSDIYNIQDIDLRELLNGKSTFAGVATPDLDPGTPNTPVFYIANEVGNYGHFKIGNSRDIIINEGETAILEWNPGKYTAGGNALWVKHTISQSGVVNLGPMDESQANNDLADPSLFMTLVDDNGVIFNKPMLYTFYDGTTSTLVISIAGASFIHQIAFGLTSAIGLKHRVIQWSFKAHTIGGTTKYIPTATNVSDWFDFSLGGGSNDSISLMTNITWQELKNLQDSNQLTAGSLYRITDYTTTTTQEGTQSANNDFDIIVEAISENTLSEESRAIKKDGDTYFANSDLEAWEIKYCLDNDTTRFAWADTVNGKGVIYYMKDEFNNECPYDFKNIKMVSSKGYYMFTFDYDGEDYSILANNNQNNIIQCYGNSIKPYYDGVQKLNFIIISSSDDYNLCYCNTFGANNSFISTNAMEYANFGDGVRGIDVLAKYAYHLTIESNNLGQEDYTFEIDDKNYELYNVKIENGVIYGRGYLSLETDPNFRTVVERDKDTNLNVYSDLYGKLKNLSDDVDELKKSSPANDLKEVDNSDYDNQANLVGYYGTLRNYGVKGENLDIKTITAYARSGTVSSTPLYCKILIRVNNNWVKLFESEEPKALNLSAGEPIVFNLTKKVDIALTDKDIVAIVFHSDNYAADNKYTATGMKTISIAGAIIGGDGDLGLTPGIQPGWAPAFSFTYSLLDEGSRTLHSDRDEVVDGIKTFQNTIKTRQGISINDKSFISNNIDGGELKVLHNNSSKGFIVRTKNTSDDILPLEILTTNGTYSFQYDFPAKNGTVALLNDLEGIKPENLIATTWSDLKSLRDASNLSAGRFYRITDYTCTTTQDNTKSAGHVFDIVVLALSENTLSEEAKAMLHEGDTYFADCDISAWKLMYCLDNDKTRFEWADETNGKGVIFRMIDEKNNDCPYDFKNILIYNDKYTDEDVTTDKYYYTFSYVVNKVLYDGTVESQVTECYGNSMKEWRNRINLNTFKNNSFGYNCYNNSFDYNCRGNWLGNNCYNNTFGDNCHINKFGNDCYNNSLGHNCHNNSFGDSCYINSLGNRCSENSFGVACHNNTFSNSFGSIGGINNTFGSFCSNNSFGSNFYNNSFGNNCENNKFGSNCYNNSFGDFFKNNSFNNFCSINSFGYNCGGNSFGDYCSDNSFGDYCFNNSFGISCQYNSFGDGCSANSFDGSCSNNSFSIYCGGNSFGNSCQYNSFGEYCGYNSFDGSCSYISFGDNLEKRRLDYDRTYITLNDEYYDDGSGQLVPTKHPDLSTQPSILPYKFMGQYVYEQLIPTSSLLIKETTAYLPDSLIDGDIILDCCVIGTYGVAPILLTRFDPSSDDWCLYHDRFGPVGFTHFDYVKIVYTSMPEEEGSSYYGYNN